jgi:hypothetical protein
MTKNCEENEIRKMGMGKWKVLLEMLKQLKMKENFVA